VELLIDVRGLEYWYEDGTAALRGIDFQLYAGESVALLGPNGSGKTTFALHLNGLLATDHPGHGTVEVCGLPVIKQNLPAVRRKVGMVFQDSDSQLFMPTVLDDVAFGPLNLGMEPVEAARHARTALARTGMADAERRAPYHLSAGEKKRVAIAGILAMDPQLLVLDEPTTFLDPPGQRDLAELLRNLPQSKIVITHDTHFARAVCSRAVFFQKGQIAGSGDITDIVDRFNWEFTTLEARPSRSGGMK
jgi:cobalt/nickel transport system ATP-binding protein